MRRHHVRSGTLASVGYDEDARVLEIRFSNGTVYQYDAVPEPVYRSLMDAWSKGWYFSVAIREMYRARRIA